MNPYYYLFYKISCFLNKKGNNEWGTMYALTILIGMNIIVVYVNFFHITENNSKGGYKIGILVISIVLFILNYILFLHKDRYKRIVSRYKKESLRSRRIGSIIAVFYMIITLVLLFFL